MKRLLQLEYYKIAPYRTAKILLICYLFLIIVTSVILARDFTLFGLPINLIELKALVPPNHWHFLTYFAAIAKLFLAIILISVLANEFNYGTLKQSLIDGLTKKEFILSKMMTNFLVALGATVLIFIIGFTIASIYPQKGVSPYADFEYIPAYFVKLFAFFSFCMFICVLIRKSALTLALLFLWNIIEGIFNAIEFVLRRKVFDAEVEPSAMWSNFLPFKAMSNLIPLPFKRIEIVDMVTQGNLNELSVKPIYYVLCIGYILLFTYLSYWIIKRRDL